MCNKHETFVQEWIWTKSNWNWISFDSNSTQMKIVRFEFDLSLSKQS